MQTTDLHKDIQSVIGCGPVRVWSLVVTIMGDLCRTPEDHLSGRTLSHLVGRLGINNQALRVALHRLRRDGWIRTQRSGRTSDYYLSESGREMTESVRQRIYGSPRAQPPQSQVVVAPPTMNMADFNASLPDHAIVVSGRIALISCDFPVPHDYLPLTLESGCPPAWLAEIVAPDNLCEEFDHLTERVQSALDHAPPATEIERVLLRLVILHHWRRLVLRQSELADQILPPDWPGAMARQQVMRALRTFPRPDLHSLQSAIEKER